MSRDGDPAPVKGSRLSSRQPGHLGQGRRGAEQAWPHPNEPLTVQWWAGLAWGMAGWGRDPSATPLQPFVG